MLRTVAEYYRSILHVAVGRTGAWAGRHLLLEIALPTLTTTLLLIAFGLPATRMDWFAVAVPFVAVLLLLLLVFLSQLAWTPVQRDRDLWKLLGTYTPRHFQVGSGTPFILGGALVVPNLELINVHPTDAVDVNVHILIKFPGQDFAWSEPIEGVVPEGIDEMPKWRRVGELLTEPLIVAPRTRRIGYAWARLPLLTDGAGVLAQPSSLDEIAKISVRLTNAINHFQICEDELWPKPRVVIWEDVTGGVPEGVAVLPDAPRV